MAKTKDNYQVTGRTVQELVMSLNFLLQRMADRMDKIEGIRGTASIESELEIGTNLDVDLLTAGEIESGPVLVSDQDGNTIHSLE